MKKEKLDSEFKELLMSRKFEQAGDNLAERIISRASTLPQKRRVGVLKRIFLLFTDIMPVPAVALTSILVIGFFIGISGNFDESAESGYNVQEFLYYEGEVL